MAGWNEINQLANAFQEVQLSSSKQKLSERNVVEIVSRLIDLKLIDVIYTLDGKEYLTPTELNKEIKDELLVHGGRINIAELQQVLNVDYSHIEAKINEMVKHDRSLMLVLGQLIDRSYLDGVAEEINDLLQEKGHVTIAEITKHYDLPADFLSQHVHERAGRIIKGRVDSYDKDVIFTDAFVCRMRSQIRGAFSAITRPVVVMSILQRYSFQERLFFSILEELIQCGRLKGSLVGGRQEKATYIPDIYTKAQNDWVDSFYRQNGYLEYDSLVRLGISEPKTFIKKRFKSENLTYLSSCCAGVGLKEQIEASMEEALATDSWADVMQLLPSIFSPEDAGQLLSECAKKRSDAVLCCDTIVTSNKFVQECQDSFKDLVALKAEKDARENPLLFTGDKDKKGSSKLSSAAADEGSTKDDRREQRKKKQAKDHQWLIEVAPGRYQMVVKGTTKSGGGTQGREVKIKATKKKYGKGRGDQLEDSGDEDTGKQGTELEFMSLSEIEAELQKNTKFVDCPDEFVTEIARKLYRPLTREYQEKGKSIFLTSTGASAGSVRKKTLGDFQEKLSGLWTNCKLFEKGISYFSAGDTEALLVRHLLKTVCTDITNIVVNAVADDHMLSISEEAALTSEGRMKIIHKLPENMQTVLVKLNSSLNSKTVDDFLAAIDVICGPEYLGIMLKKPDKRKERQLIFNHRQILIEQLTAEGDPAMLLHLSSVILFQTFTQTIVHAPGKCVPQIIAFIEFYMEEEKHKKLLTLQELVVKQIKLQGSTEEEEVQKVKSEIETLTGEVKDIAITTKKAAQQEAAKS